MNIDSSKCMNYSTIYLYRIHGSDFILIGEMKIFSRIAELNAHRLYSKHGCVSNDHTHKREREQSSKTGKVYKVNAHAFTRS